MPDRTISFLSYTALGLVFVYLFLMVATVTLATWRTDLAGSVRDTEYAISMLESEYYAAIENIGNIDPSAIGLVKPVAVTYVAMTLPPGLSRR